MKTTTFAALFVASVLLIGGFAASENPAYAFTVGQPVPLFDFWDMFDGVIQGSGWGWL